MWICIPRPGVLCDHRDPAVAGERLDVGQTAMVAIQIAGILLVVPLLASGVGPGRSLEAKPKTVAAPTDEGYQIIVARTLERCRALQRCGAVLRRRPCACSNETFPCKERDDRGGGCTIRFTCTQIDIVQRNVLVRGPDLMCENSPGSPLESSLAAKLPPGMLPLADRPKTCDAAVALVIGWLDPPLRQKIRMLPRSEMIRFVNSWGHDILYVMGESEALLSDCRRAAKGPAAYSIASMSILDRIWVGLQEH